MVTESFVFNRNEVASYSTAGEIASVFEAKSRELIELHRRANQIIGELNTTFKGDPSRTFSAKLDVCGSTSEVQILRNMKRIAWRTLIDKLGIRQLMSFKRIKEMDAALHHSGSGDYPRESDPVDQLPEITPDTIMDVLSGYAASANEFLTEKAQEVYEFLKPWQNDSYKTNEKNRWKLSRKIIITYGCEACGGQGGFRLGWGDTADKIQSLDIVMHLLDGKGIPAGHTSPLGTAIYGNTTGETPYFEFKCFKNRNLHLVIKRQDLIDEFNFLCGHPKELPGAKTGGRYERHTKQYDFTDIEPGVNGEFDLFETPKALADEMCEMAGIADGDRVLEPSAGPGRLINAVIHRGATVVAIETQGDLCRKGYYHQDFLQADPETFGMFDAVVMNPPFSRSQDAAHCRHAYSFLKPHGRLVAVASAGVKFRSDKRSVEFREWLARVDARVVDLPEGTFKESGTMVRAVLISVQRGA